MKQYFYLCLMVLLNLIACSQVEGNVKPTPVVEPILATSSVPTIDNLSGQFDSAMVWPLCGRISEDPPSGWDVSQGCPSERQGNPNFTDGPIASTYGPRPLVSENHRYDFHRGLDLTSPVGTPVFAITDGVVRIAGNHSSYSDPMVQIRHYRPNSNSCSGQGCYHSNYMHLSAWTVSVNESVTKGQLIGYTGTSQSGYAHLHFEIRNSPGGHDAYSAWQRDSIHPLTALPHPDTSNATNISLSFANVDLSTPRNPKPTLVISMPSGDELDLRRLEVEVYKRKGQRLIAQVGDQPVGNTPEGTGYYVNPSWFDFMDWNRMYTYKNSSSYPWNSFECSGTYESPYCQDLPSSYNSNIHMDAQSPNDRHVGEFNGITVWPEHHNAQSSTYNLQVRFNKLKGPLRTSGLCIRTRALDTNGQGTNWVTYGNCRRL